MRSSQDHDRRIEVTAAQHYPLAPIHTPPKASPLGTARTPSNASDAGQHERDAVAHLVDRPLLIVGNGPSAAVPAHNRLPEDLVVFRTNWFFLESHYHYGRHVDAWFYAIEHQLLEQRLHEQISAGIYDVDAISSPMFVPALRDGEEWASRLHELGMAEWDHWNLIAENPTLGRFLMSRPLPTSGMQILGFALAAGFREIHLVGVDMYESTDARYGHAVPDDVRASLKAKDLTPGYEANHAIARDLAFLDHLLELHPDATIYNHGPSRHLKARLEEPPEVPEGKRLIDSDPSVGRGKPVISLPLDDVARWDEAVTPELVEQPGGGYPYAERHGRRVAYVTLVSGDFHHGARALHRSLRKVSDIPLIALCLPTADRVALRRSGIACVDVPEIVNPNELATPQQRRFAATYSKLHVFRMPHLDRVVYLDADTLVLQNPDELFDGDEFRAAPDVGLEIHTETFNSGVFAVSPSHELFEEMLEAMRTTESYDGGDQGFLNVFYEGRWDAVDTAYNTTKRVFAHHAPMFHRDEVKVLHYVGPKPWQPKADGGEKYTELEWLWVRQLEDFELYDLVEHLRVVGANDGSELPPEYEKGSPLRRAQAMNERGDHRLAVQTLTDLWPGDARATSAEELEMATALQALGVHEEALPYLERAVEKNPKSRRIRQALETARDAVGVSPHDGTLATASKHVQDVHARAVELLGEGRHGSAESLLRRRWPQDEPAPAALHRSLAQALVAQGRLPEAVAELRKATETPEGEPLAQEMKMLDGRAVSSFARRNYVRVRRRAGRALGR